MEVEFVVSVIAQEIERKLESRSIIEIGQRWNLKDELEKIKLSVSCIQPMLRNAEENSWGNSHLYQWLGNLKETLYDAEDMLDEFSAASLRQKLMTGNRLAKEVRGFLLRSNQFVVYDRKIKEIRVRLYEIADEHDQFGLGTIFGMRTFEPWSRKQRRFVFLPEQVTGREDDKEAIIELLLSSSNGDEENNVSVIAIVGIGGSGKTTFAGVVFNDERVKMHFELMIWVWVSDDVFDIKSIVQQILEFVSPSSKQPIDSDSETDSEIDSLKHHLHEKINGRKYLMVLDDVWNESYENWVVLRDLLACGASGSKIMVTTRLKTAAEMMHPLAIHKLRDLSDLESWSLFEQEVLREGQVLTPTHERIGKEIVAKCSGVPLAIRTMGRFLHSDKDSWLLIRDKELSEINSREKKSQKFIRENVLLYPL